MESYQKQTLKVSEFYFARDFVNLCISHWGWFVISMIISLSVGFFVILKTQNVYRRSSVILIKESAAKRSGSELETMLSTGGISQMNTKLVNEIEAIKSHDLIKEVVSRLNLNINYYTEGHLKNTVLYGSANPIEVIFTGDDARFSKFKVEKDGDKLKLFGISDSSKKLSDPVYSLNPGDTVVTPVGTICIRLNKNFRGNWNKPVLVTHSDIRSIAGKYSSRVNATELNAKNYSDLMELSIQDESPARAEDFLNMLIAVYNENWVNDRNQVARSTSYFINERLSNIERELDLVDSDISAFKSKNLLPDINTVSSMYMKKSDDLDSKARELDNQLHVVEYTRSCLEDISDSSLLIPALSGISNSSISEQISSFNTLQLQRNNLLENSSEKNPLVQEMNANLSSMRRSIITSLDEEIEVLKSQLGRLRNMEKQTNARIADNPNQVKYLSDIERQQKVKETLYVYLLQKREENELSQAFSAYNTKIISKPSGSNVPVLPQKSRILLIALFIGFFIPVAILYIREFTNTKVRGRKDLDGLSLPLLGEVPQNPGTKSRFGTDDEDAAPPLLVRNGRRNSINESFRVLRTNIEFVAKTDNSKVFAITSFNAGSGKSFISTNICSAIAIIGKRVLLIDGDLRHASTSKTVKANSDLGFADYLGGAHDTVDDLIVPHPEIKGLDILPVGTIPPNPTELVSGEKFRNVISHYREKYDYVIVDCPPLEIVADTQIIEAYVDRTLFVVRAGLFEKVMLSELENLKDRSEYKKISVILNGTETQGSYYGYSYGYHYGYSYGYGYHYHHYEGDDEENRETLGKKIKRFFKA